MDSSFFSGIVYFKILGLKHLRNFVAPSFLNNGPVRIKRWMSPFQTFRGESLRIRNHYPFPKNELIPFLWNSLFQNFRGKALEKSCVPPF